MTYLFVIITDTIGYLQVAFVPGCLIRYWDFKKVSHSTQRVGTSQLTFSSNHLFFSKLLVYYYYVLFGIYHEIKAHPEKRLISFGDDERKSVEETIHK